MCKATRWATNSRTLPPTTGVQPSGFGHYLRITGALCDAGRGSACPPEGVNPTGYQHSNRKDHHGYADGHQNDWPDSQRSRIEYEVAIPKFAFVPPTGYQHTNGKDHHGYADGHQNDWPDSQMAVFFRQRRNLGFNIHGLEVTQRSSTLELREHCWLRIAEQVRGSGGILLHGGWFRCRCWRRNRRRRGRRRRYRGEPLPPGLEQPQRHCRLRRGRRHRCSGRSGRRHRCSRWSGRRRLGGFRCECFHHLGLGRRQRSFNENLLLGHVCKSDGHDSSIAASPPIIDLHNQMMGGFGLVVQGDYSSQLTIGGVQRKGSGVGAFQGIGQGVTVGVSGGNRGA